mmetsp:Transcript_114095/g.179622  ORF Transcript_114095/g.179622 Transcript_114095/m.179622 type:complete len:118 (+) Transcript_114095:17-370(+)
MYKKSTNKQQRQTVPNGALDNAPVAVSVGHALRMPSSHAFTRSSHADSQASVMFWKTHTRTQLTILAAGQLAEGPFFFQAVLACNMKACIVLCIKYATNQLQVYFKPRLLDTRPQLL